MKAEAVKPSKNEVQELIKQKNRDNTIKAEDIALTDFFKAQKAYRIKQKQRILKQADLDEMRIQISMTEKGVEGFPKMLWYGMPYPINILKCSYNLGLEAYSELLKDETELKNKLLKEYNLTDTEIKTVEGGDYVKNIKKS